MDRQRPPYERNEKDNTSTGIPHFESKYKVEQHIQNLGIPYTIIGPTSLMENLLSYSRAGLRQGQLALPLPPSTILQQIALENIAEFSTLVLERRNSFLGKRIDIASDELTGEQAAKILSEELGRKIKYVQVPLVFSVIYCTPRAIRLSFFTFLLLFLC
ncbi:MAG TPA: NmrA family NAD(P)-binding protein [Methylomirabilota bacterium]|nr:NmrA family NAD(P)-binding protein [Methylomirabilota bacterium]